MGHAKHQPRLEDSDNDTVAIYQIQGGLVDHEPEKREALRVVYTPEGHGECEMMPPPRHLFAEMVKCLRRIGAEAAKNAASHFKVSYSRTSDERKVVVFIKHDAPGDIHEELGAMLHQVYEEEEARLKSS